MTGIIGGSGLYHINGVTIKKKYRVKTPYGVPSGAYLIGEFSGRTVVFLPRHGARHAVPPHKVNYRANIWGFKELGVDRVLSVGAVGGISPGATPGTLVVLDQIIDMTRSRKSTFYEGKTGVVHIDLTEPYCPELRKILLSASRGSAVIRKSGTYVCTEGPRLETKAEIMFFARIGADVVGMTGMPEAALAREAEMCYAGIAVVTNFAAGLRKTPLTVREVLETMQNATENLHALLKDVLVKMPPRRGCSCKDALTKAII